MTRRMITQTILLIVTLLFVMDVAAAELVKHIP